MAVKRIDSVFDIPALEAEYGQYLALLKSSQADLVGVYEAMKKVKASDLGGFVKAVEDQAEATKKATDSAGKAKESNDNIVKSGKSVIENNRKIGASYSDVSGALEQNLATQLRYKVSLEELKKEQKALQAESAKTGDSSGKLSARQIEVARSIEELKQASTELQRTIRLQVKEQGSAMGSLDQMKAAYDRLFQVFRGLSDEEKNSEFGKQLNSDLDELGNKINQVQMSAGNFSANVARYGESLAQPFDLLGRQLAQLKQNYAKGIGIGPDATSVRGLEMARSAISDIDKVFIKASRDGATTTQIVRQMENAFLKLSTSAAGGDDGLKQFLEEFKVQLGQAKDEIQDLKAEVKFNASDTKYLDGIAEGISGAAGAYGVYQSAAVLAGVENEELEKTMVKLQATLTLVTSLQSVLNVIQTESAAVQTLLSIKTGILSIAKAIQAKLTATQITATIAATAATGAEAVAVETATVALSTASVAAVAAANANTQLAITATSTTLALSAEATAATAATAATRTFSTALIASGIGAVILAIGVGVAFLVSKMKDWTAATSLNSDQQRALNETLSSQYDILKRLTDLIALSYRSENDLLGQQERLLGAAGANQYKLFAIKEKIANLNKTEADKALGLVLADAEKNYASEGLKGMVALQRQRADVLHDYEKIVKSTQSLTQGLATEEAKVGKAREENVIESIKKEIDNRNASADALKKVYDYTTEVLNNATNADNTIAELAVQKQKFLADERRKIELESAKIEADLVMSKNNDILSNERSTQAERLAAVAENARQRRAIIDAELKDVQTDPSRAGTADETIAIKRASAERTKVARDEAKEKFEINEFFRKKLLDAQLQYNKITLDYNKSLQQQIMDDENQSFDSRLNYLQLYIGDSQRLLEAEYKHTIATTILTNEERLTLDADYHSKLVALAAEAQQKITAIVKSQLQIRNKMTDDEIRRIERFYESISVVDNQAYTKEISALTEQLNKKKISYEKYQQQKEKIDAKYSKKGIQAQIAIFQKELDLFDDHSEDIKRIQEEIANNRSLLPSASADEKKQLSERITRLTEELNFLQGYQDKRIAIMNKIADAQRQLDVSDAESNEKKKQERKALIDQNISAGLSLFGELTGVMNAYYDAQLARLDEIQKRLNEDKERQINNINQLGLSEEERLKRIAQVQKQADFESQQIEVRKRRIQVQNAKFERAASIANIIANTAQAVSKAYAQGGTLGYILAGLVAAVGAAQIARVLATPIPQYRHGRGEGKDEIAWTGDGGQHEYIWRSQTKTIEKTPAIPTLTHLLPKDVVWPNKQAMQRELAMSALPPLSSLHVTRNGHIVNNDMASAIDMMARRNSDQAEANTNKIVRAIREQQNPVFNLVVEVPIESTDYYRRNLK